MAKKKVVVTTSSKKKVTPTVSKARKNTSKSVVKNEPLIFGKTNYFMMLGGIGLIMIGLLLMSGGAMPSPDVWDESLIYSARRTVIAPLVILLGIVANMVAIFYKPKEEAPTSAIADL